MNNYFKITDGPKSPKTSALMDTMRSKFKVWSWYDDKQLDKDFPVPKKATTRYFAKTVEADEDLKNKSAEQLEEEGIECITLRERLMAEIQYFDETGQNLDVNNITLCAGSRYAGGDVPGVGRDDDGGVHVGGCGVGRFGPDGRARRASLVPSAPCDLVPLSLDSAIKTCKENGLIVSKPL